MSVYCTPRRTVSELKKHLFWVMPTGGMPETISTEWNSVTRLFSKMAARGEKCRCSFDAIASLRPMVFPLSWKVVFFELWQCSARGAIYSSHLFEIFTYLGAFLNGIEKPTVIIVVYVRPSARPPAHVEQLDFQWLDFREMLYWELSLTSVEEIQVWLISYKNKMWFIWNPTYVSRLKDQLTI
jgi:hypothetical protein